MVERKGFLTLLTLRLSMLETKIVFGVALVLVLVVGFVSANCFCFNSEIENARITQSILQKVYLAYGDVHVSQSFLQRNYFFQTNKIK